MRSSRRWVISGAGRWRELAQVREAELRVRCPGSSRARAAVPVDPDRPGTEDQGQAAGRRGGGEGAAGACPACRVRGAERADRGGERVDLRGQACVAAGRRRRQQPSVPEDGKGGLCDAIAQEKAAEIGRLAALAARSLGCGDAGMEAAEAVIRAGMLQAGCGMLEKLLAADPGYRGPRVPCGQGHQAGFLSYRDKVIDTVLGPVTLTRAWYHCAACRHGLAPRDAELGVAGASLSPGLAAMNDRAVGRGAVRGGRRAAEGPGRGAADRQARRAGRRGQRRRAGCRRPEAVRADHLPEGAAAAAVPGPGQAVCRHRRHRCAHDIERDRRAGREGPGRPRPAPARSSSPCSSPRTRPMTTGIRSGT